MHRKSRIIALVILFAMIVVVVADFYLERQRQSQMEAHQAELKTEARPLEREKALLETELIERQRAKDESKEVGRIMVADRVNSVSDLKSAKDIILIDTKASDELLVAAAETGQEVVLACEKFNLKKITAIHSVCPLSAVLIDANARGKRNLKDLMELGIKNYVVFVENGHFRIGKSDCVELTYSAVKTANYSIGDRIRQIEYKKGAHIVVFWHSLSKEEQAGNRDIIKEEIKNGNLVQCSIAEANAAAWSLHRSEEKRDKEFNEFAEEQQKKIDELQARIDEIYSHYYD